MPVEISSDDGTRLAARVVGKGRPVVLVHGAGSLSSDWTLAARELASDHRVIAYDRRGRGRSGDSPSYALEREIEDLLAVLRWTGEPAHLVGHSFGARVCLAAAPRADLLSVSLYEPPIALDRLEGSVLERARQAHDRQDWEGVLQVFQPVAGMTPDEIAFCTGLPELRAAQRDAARSLTRELAAIAHRPEVGGLTAPAHVLVGGNTDSPVYLDGLEELAERMGAQRTVLPGQRHAAFAGDPQGFVAALRAFWASAA